MIDRLLLIVLFFQNKYYFLSFELIKAATTGAPIIAASEPMTVAAFLTVDVVGGEVVHLLLNDGMAAVFDMDDGIVGELGADEAAFGGGGGEGGEYVHRSRH